MKKWQIVALAALLALACVLLPSCNETDYSEVTPLPYNPLPTGDESVTTTPSESGDGVSDPMLWDDTTTPSAEGTQPESGENTTARQTDSQQGGTAVRGTTRYTTVRDSQKTTVPSTTQKRSTTTQKPTTTTTTQKPTTTTTTTAGVSGLPQKGDRPHKNLEYTAVTLVGNTLSVTVKNLTFASETNQEDYLRYTCYGRNNNSLGTVDLFIGRINPGVENTCSVTLPEGTRRMELTDVQVEFWTHGWV